MSSKKDEEKAFKALLKEFPGNVVELSCSYNNFGIKPKMIYRAYCNGLGGLSTIEENFYTPKDAVDRLIQMRKEAQDAYDYASAKDSN